MTIQSGTLALTVVIPDVLGKGETSPQSLFILCLYKMGIFRGNTPQGKEQRTFQGDGAKSSWLPIEMKTDDRGFLLL